MKLTDAQIATFNQEVWRHYNRHARHELPWRQPEKDDTFDPYKIWLSELMLQQTQVNRVVSKYQAFLQQFPTIHALANAPLGEVLVAWQGLGYNRRAKYLWQAAQTVQENWGGKLPPELPQLVSLPGVGANTAGAIMAYAFNKPALFIETNIRSVFFYHFFADKREITDKEILDVLEQTLDSGNPREYYWALMDYGSYLKRQGHGNIHRSKHYSKQSKFEGSLRQIRGRTLKLLGERAMTEDELIVTLADERAAQVLERLKKEGFIKVMDGRYRLA